MSQELITWKTDAWKNPEMVAWYHQRMIENTGTNTLKNEVEVGLCRQYAVGHKLLDVGIGTGRGSLPLAREGFDLTGVDSSQAMLDQCAKLAGELPVRLLRRDLADLGFSEGEFDTLVSLNVMVHFPHWGEVLREWRRVVSPAGRIVFDIHSLDHELAAAGALGLKPPSEELPPDRYINRVRAQELAETADALDLAIVAVVPYAGIFAGGNPNYWLHSSLAYGARFDRLLSWLSIDARLFEFALFLEREVFAALTPKVTGRMMVVLENRADRVANAAWLQRNQALDDALAGEPLRREVLIDMLPAWDADWQTRLDAHLDWPRNRVLLHFLLSNFAGRVDLASFLATRHAETLTDWQRRLVFDLLTTKSLREFAAAPEFAKAFDYHGVNLRPGLEYELTQTMLTSYFKAFPNT